MNANAGGGQFVGVVTQGGISSSILEPLCIEPALMEKTGREAPAELPKMSELNQDQHDKLLAYLTGRLANGGTVRDRKLYRYARIDRTISTWQKLNPEDSQRELIEDNTGKQQALPFNLPVLAAHLNDMTSYYAEALAPISNPFFSASGDQNATALLNKMNRDAIARNYYSELTLTVRSLLKYNIGGFCLTWDDGVTYGNKTVTPGNYWKSLDMYNTLWDPAIRDISQLSTKGEWAATCRIANRLEMIRNSLNGTWVGLETYLEAKTTATTGMSYYKEPATQGGLTEEGQDARTTSNQETSINWSSYGLGISTDLGPEVDGFEIVDMYCWLVPDQFGLLNAAEQSNLNNSERDPETFLELWKFTLVGSTYIVQANPVLPREQTVAGELCEIPIYLSYMTQDQIKQAQRSFMELMRGFQRFTSAMYNIYIAGMRGKVWGLTGYDPSMFDMTGISKGDTAGVVPSKQPGRDVRTGLMNMSPNSGVDDALQAVDSSLTIMNQFFPAQSMPSQVAGIDRAIKSQVATVVQGAMKSMRTILRVMDSSLMLPVRLGGYRNLKRNDPQGLEQVDDATVAKLVGSGIESMESERVADSLWQLMYAIIQNQESMQTFDIPKIFAYLSRVSNLSVDLGQFVRQPPPTAPGTQQPVPAAVPGA